MAKTIWLVKHNGQMVPATEDDREAIASLGDGEALEGPWTKKHERTVWRHRKFFAMLNYAYDNWDPHPNPDALDSARWHNGEAGYYYEVRGQLEEVTKSRDLFRKDLIILAGYYEAHFKITGEVRMEAKSIAFANMDDDEFYKLYYDVHDVIRKHILRNYTREELDRVLAEHERFQ